MSSFGSSHSPSCNGIHPKIAHTLRTVEGRGFFPPSMFVIVMRVTLQASASDCESIARSFIFWRSFLLYLGFVFSLILFSFRFLKHHYLTIMFPQIQQLSFAFIFHIFFFFA
jgi:hypothetical protein